MPDPVVLINIFEVPDSDAKEFITAWERTRDYLKTLDGHLRHCAASSELTRC